MYGDFSVRECTDCLLCVYVRENNDLDALWGGWPCLPKSDRRGNDTTEGSEAKMNRWVGKRDCVGGIRKGR